MKNRSEINVLIACEESGTVRDAFLNLGFNAVSCDILPTSSPGPHIQGDAIKALNSKKWDLVVAHPPCTYLSNSGVRWLFSKKEGLNIDRIKKLFEAAKFFKEFVQFAKESGVPVAIENPIMHKYGKNEIFEEERERKPTQVVQPWQFGHGETKATCFWLYGLPPLIPTDIVEGREQRIWKLPPSEDRQKLRSKTFKGIAEAMAKQWGDFILKSEDLFCSKYPKN